MKLKQQPDDFRVEELTGVTAGQTGLHALYRLEKSSWATLDALAAVRRRWKIEPRRISYGGLKDKHARTVQYFTIFHGPRRNLTQQTIRVQYLGHVDEPFTSTDICGNRFQIVLRGLQEREIETAERGLGEIEINGVPNYFDDQRFGSVSGGEFVARLMALGRFEDALRTALTAPYEFDPAAQKREKVIVRNHWGEWETCRRKLRRGDAQRVIGYLTESPDDFRGAIARLRPEFVGFYLSAYQSHLWNRMLARWLRIQLVPNQLGIMRQRISEMPVHRQLTDAQRETLKATTLPLPSARVHLERSDERLALMESVLAEDGITLQQLQFKGERGMFFSKGERAVLCTPNNLRHVAANDELNPDRLRLQLEFDLARGCYATLIVKRITACRFSD